ncbi:MAG: enoyl-CoA hydratase/isomerase family protein [Betaproteobacteria bacterium]|nr:enoyl-CoA hydratase/isomerase family protein [Betaproteobacteria bacterium]
MTEHAVNASPFETIELDREDRVAVIKLNRPEVLNAISQRMVGELSQVLSDLNKDNGVRVVVLTAKDRGFCAGADIKESAGRSLAQQLYFLRSLNDLILQMEGLAKPVIAAIDGWALGGGFELMLGADLVLATQASVFGTPEINRGGMPAAGGTQRLPRLIGRTKAKDLLFTGRNVTAAEAEKLGLVNQVFPGKEELAAACMKLAHALAEKAPLGLMQMKRLVNLGTDMPLTLALEMAHEAATLIMASYDKQEGSKAFTEKRKPQFKGE